MISHVVFKLAFFEIVKHIIDIVDTHVDCDDTRSEFTIANACWSFEVLFKMPLEVKLRRVLQPTDLASDSDGLLQFLTVKNEQMRYYFGATQLDIVGFKCEHQSWGIIGIWQKGGEVLLDERQVEANVVMPFDR